ncbi:hypothetical protein [Pyxidicoccus trucidator]|nr:hypothetical protein [Pyxidicoccus trucidator]
MERARGVNAASPQVYVALFESGNRGTVLGGVGRQPRPRGR